MRSPLLSDELRSPDNSDSIARAISDNVSNASAGSKTVTDSPPALNPTNRDRYVEWLYARAQSVSRAQSHYLLLLLLVAVYSVAVHLSGSATVQVQILGLDVPKALVEAGAVSVLAVMTLGFFGAAQASQMAYHRLADLLDETEGWALIEATDHPNLLDYLELSTYRNGRPWGPTVIGWLILYPLPLVAALGWAVLLWWIGLHAQSCPWPWLRYVHYANAAILALTVIRAVAFLVRHVVVIAAAVSKGPPPQAQQRP
jgi:hypothetical protein